MLNAFFRTYMFNVCTAMVLASLVSETALSKNLELWDHMPCREMTFNKDAREMDLSALEVFARKSCQGDNKPKLAWSCYEISLYYYRKRFSWQGF